MQETEEQNVKQESQEAGSNEEKVTEIDVTELRSKMQEQLNHKIQIKVSLSQLVLAIILAIAFFYFGILAIFKISA